MELESCSKSWEGMQQRFLLLQKDNVSFSAFCCNFHILSKNVLKLFSYRQRLEELTFIQASRSKAYFRLRSSILFRYARS